MIGAIIGDIVGSRFEFNNTSRMDFDLFTPECDYTDDTICTVAIADAVLNGKSYKDSLLEWCRKYPHPKGAYGGSFSAWINSANPQPYNSFGNGSAMRVSPVGWLFTSQEQVLLEAKRSAEVSHDHTEGIKGAQCIADLIYQMRTGMIKKPIGGRSITLTSFNYHIPALNVIRQMRVFDETCQVTVPQAIRCFIEGVNFEECIRLAVSIGGDSDTIAAITGSLAEAYYGIPAYLKDQALSYLPEDMKKIINQFNKATC